MLPNFSYVKPGSIKDAVKHLSDSGALVHGGGTDLLGCLRDGVFGAGKLVSLQGLKALRGLRSDGNGGLRIGALVTLAELAGNPDLKKNRAVLAQAAFSAASPQLRNQGTIGGNICQKPRCWYYRGEYHCLRKGGDECFAFGGENQFHCIMGGENCYIVHPSDPSAALVALEATVKTTGPGGGRSIPMESFHVRPEDDPQKETVLQTGEFVTEITVPGLPAGTRSRYRKVRARQSWDFALAGSALAITFDGDTVSRARVVFSGVAPFPWRSKEVEAEITGKKLDLAVIEKAAEVAVAQAEPLEKNGYKVAILKAVVEEELAAIAKG